MKRRQFLQISLIGTTALAIPLPEVAKANKPETDINKITEQIMQTVNDPNFSPVSAHNLFYHPGGEYIKHPTKLHLEVRQDNNSGITKVPGNKVEIKAPDGTCAYYKINY